MKITRFRYVYNEIVCVYNFNNMFQYMNWISVIFDINNCLKCTCHQKIFFDMWKGHSLEVHCTNIQLNIFTK